MYVSFNMLLQKKGKVWTMETGMDEKVRRLPCMHASNIVARARSINWRRRSPLMLWPGSRGADDDG